MIGRGSKLHPLYQRVAEAKAPRAIVVPNQAQRGVQVTGIHAQLFLVPGMWQPGVQMMEADVLTYSASLRLFVHVHQLHLPEKGL